MTQAFAVAESEGKFMSKVKPDPEDDILDSSSDDIGGDSGTSNDLAAMDNASNNKSNGSSKRSSSNKEVKLLDDDEKDVVEVPTRKMASMSLAARVRQKFGDKENATARVQPKPTIKANAKPAVAMSGVGPSQRKATRQPRAATLSKPMLVDSDSEQDSDEFEGMVDSEDDSSTVQVTFLSYLQQGFFSEGIGLRKEKSLQ